jgi:hypothetical protein
LDENSLGLDSDGDRIVDFDETERFGTSSSNADTDGDGLDDYQDIKLSMFDDDHGFAMDKDARDDIDGDGLAPELDFDSDDGGCSDGLEDTNRDGSISADETSPFDPEDDGCISGYFTVAYLHESETPSQMSHTEYRYDVELSMKPSEAGNVEGTGVTEWYYYDSLTSSTCDWFAGPVEVEWPVVLTGRFTDDVLSFEVVPPSKTVDVAVTGSCGGDTFPVVVNHFPGWADITFTDGKYEYRAVTEFEPPNRGGSEVELVLWRREVPPVAPGRLRAAPGLTPK